jgi:hypothetical protein
MLRIIISPTGPKVNSNQQEKHIYEEVIFVLDGKGLALPLNDWHTCERWNLQAKIAKLYWGLRLNPPKDLKRQVHGMACRALT